jgi:short chain dehydrogenase
MPQARVGVTEGAEQQPSHQAIDNGNPAKFKPAYLVLDDINVDLISVAVVAALIASVSVFHFSSTKALLLSAAIILPLRTFFPRPTNPQGLVLITGASSGIGAELSYIFAGKGHDLVLVGRNEDQLEVVKGNVEQKMGRTAHTIVSDLSVTGAAKELYDRVKQQGLVVDVLVNGAGLGGAGDTLEQPIELVERMTVLNCIAPVQLTQLFGRDMADRGRGWLLHISSVGGK